MGLFPLILFFFILVQGVFIKGLFITICFIITYNNVFVAKRFNTEAFNHAATSLTRPVDNRICCK